MIPFLKNTRINFPIAALSILILSLTVIAFAPAKKGKRNSSGKRLDPQTVSIPSGSFYMGASDEQMDLSMVNRKKLVSVQSFWMDRTEVTNEQYRRFVKYVSDSLKFLAIYGGGINQNEDTIRVDWARATRINQNSKAVLEKLNELLLSPDNRIQGKIEIDPNKLIYKYSFVDLKAAAKASKGLEQSLGDYLITVNQNVYPDTLVWMRDFSYSYNEPLAKRYYAHPAYGNYPVVGVTWKQAVAFCHWRTHIQNADFAKKKIAVDGDYRLPNEAEWEYAARGGRTSTMFPWGSPYLRNKKGCLLANFKPGRGNYPEDGGFYTVKATAYWPNDFGLYNMSGNVAEWTASYFYEGSYNFMSDLSPDVRIEADENDPPRMKRKVVRGGSWKDVGNALQVSARAYEYQDTAKSYIGFRTVIDLAPRSKK
jgi:sulfatase modifying factor 1